MPVDHVMTEGGEVRVETGLGRVETFVVKPAKRNHHVAIAAEHLREPVQGWVDGNDHELMDRLATAHDGGLRVAYCVIVKRKARAPLGTPIAELDRNDKVRELHDLVHVNGAGDPLQPLRPTPAPAGTSSSPEPDRPPSPDVAKQEAPQVSDPPPAPPAGDPGPPYCGRCGQSMRGYAGRRGPNGPEHADGCPVPGGDAPFTDDDGPGIAGDDVAEGSQQSMRDAGLAATAQRQAQRAGGTRLCNLCDTQVPAAELAAHLAAHTAETSSGGGDTPTVPTEPPPPDPASLKPSMRDRFGRGPRVGEDKAWEPTNSDGSLNLGSYVYQAAFGMTTLAAELLMERNRALAAESGAELEVPTPGQMRGLARQLLRAADKAQASIRPDGRIDRGANSHTRARAAVRAALDWFPPPWGGTDADRAVWSDALADHAWELMRCAVALTEPDGDLS